jgi:SAM-dependent methyltransferase
MIPGAIHELLFKFGGDTRRRNLDVARALKPVLSEAQTLLDAGCGEYGLADFLPATRVVGTDSICPARLGRRLTFFQASIASLPFANLSFPVVASVDTLEHLPFEMRDRALAEMFRVARAALVVAFPCGRRARQTDEEFQKNLARLDKAQPEWLVEHLQDAYPSVEWVLSKIRAESVKYDRPCDTTVCYSEQIRVTQILRWAAVRSDLLYIGINLIAGILGSIVPRPNANNSYRAIVLLRFR